LAPAFDFFDNFGKIIKTEYSDDIYAPLVILNLSNHAAHSAHQPYILVYALTMIAFVFYLGRKYAYWREHGLWQQVDLLIKLGSKLSFGVYLVQTIPLTLLAYFLAQIQIAAWLLVVLTPLFYL